MNKIKKKLLIVIFLVLVFLLAVIVWYSPAIFKGYPTQIISDDILLAKNYYQIGILATQSNRSVVISPNLIKAEGYPLEMFQHLRSFFYAKVFNITGIPGYNDLILISTILYALILIIFVILTLYLFNFRIALVFSLIYIFSPLGWGLARTLGSYEFCLFFWALFFLFFFIGTRRTEQSKNKFNIVFFSLSGIFLAFSALSKEVTLVFALVLFLFLAIKNFKRQLIYIFIPFCILLIIFWLPSFLSGENRYLSLLTNRATEKSVYVAELHIFPDAYTYYFEKEEFFDSLKNQDLGLSENIENRRALANFGFSKIGIIDRFKAFVYLLSQHVFRFFSLEEFGGPFITLFFILGIVYLRSKYKFLYNLSVYWLIISFFVFIFVMLLGRNHLMDFIWIIILSITLGLLCFFQIIKDYFKLNKQKSIIFDIILISLIVYHFVLVNHVVLGREYDKDFVPRSMVYARIINGLEIQDRDIIAIPGDFPGQDTTLNYLTNKSFIIFRASTIEKLIKKDKLKQSFDFFDINYILGYSDELSQKMVEKVKLINIVSDSLEIDMGKASNDKSFFMNLIR